MSATPILDGTLPMPLRVRARGIRSSVVTLVTLAIYGAITGATDRIGSLPLSGDPTVGPLEAGIVTMVAVIGTSVLATVIHECGHALAGLAVGYRFVSLDVFGYGVVATKNGPRVRRSPVPGSLTLMVPPRGAGRRSRLIFFSGGVAANLATVTIASIAPFRGEPFVDFALWTIGAISSAMIVNNLWPDRRRRHASDGAQILGALLNSARYRRAVELGRIARELENGGSPESISDTELDAIAGPDDASLESMRANVIRYSAHADRDRDTAALDLERALRSSAYATAAERAALAVEAAIFTGWHRADAVGFERWSARAAAGPKEPIASLRLEAVAAWLRGDTALAIAVVDRLAALVDEAVMPAHKETARAALTRFRDRILAESVESRRDAGAPAVGGQ